MKKIKNWYNTTSNILWFINGLHSTLLATFINLQCAKTQYPYDILYLGLLSFCVTIVSCHIKNDSKKILYYSGVLLLVWAIAFCTTQWVLLGSFCFLGSGVLLLKALFQYFDSKEGAYQNGMQKLLVSSGLIICILLLVVPSSIYNLVLLMELLLCGGVVLYAVKNQYPNWSVSKQRQYKNSIYLFVFCVLPILLTQYMMRFSMNPNVNSYQDLNVAYHYWNYNALTIPLYLGYLLGHEKQPIPQFIHRKLVALVLLMVLVGGASWCANYYVWNIPTTIYMLMLSSVLLLCNALLSVYMYSYFNCNRSVVNGKEVLEQNYMKQLLQIDSVKGTNRLLHWLKESMQETMQPLGYLVFYKEQEKWYVLAQEGTFESYEMKAEVFPLEATTYFSYEGQEYPMFPLSHKQETIGYLVINRIKQDWKESDILLIKQYGAYLGRLQALKEWDVTSQIAQHTQPVADSEQAYVLLQQMGQFRKEVSFYLHDDLLQNILAVKNIVSALQTKDQALQQMVMETLDTINESVREEMYELYPSTLMDLPFIQTIHVLCHKLQQKHPDLRIVVQGEITTTVPDSIAFALYRMIKELLQNAIKHADASTLTVLLQDTKTHLQVDVLDDGKGFDIEFHDTKNNSKHIGLSSIQYEVGILGGNITLLESEKGTHFNIVLPISGKEYESNFSG